MGTRPFSVCVCVCMTGMSVPVGSLLSKTSTIYFKLTNCSFIFYQTQYFLHTIFYIRTCSRYVIVGRVESDKYVWLIVILIDNVDDDTGPLGVG